jgi:hypothetical protein
MSLAGGIICLLSTLPFTWPELTLPTTALAIVLFIRGFGSGFIMMPSIVSGYSSVPKSSLTDAATTINIVQRLGGPLATMGIAMVLQQIANIAADGDPSATDAVSHAIPPVAFPAAFVLLCAINLLCLIPASRLARTA